MSTLRVERRPLAFALLLVFGLTAFGAPQAAKHERIERLVALCKLWNAVKYFHPYLAYRTDIDWDKALVGAVPRVNEAKSAAEYAAAVGQMLRALNDPATRILAANPGPLSSPAKSAEKRPPDPTFQSFADGVLLVRVNHYADLMDFNGVIQRAAAIRQEIDKAKGVVFDLRPPAPLSEAESGNLGILFNYAQLAGALSATALSPPGERRRMHVGFVPQRGVTSGGYESAFYTALGPRIPAAQDAKDHALVFLINQYSELPSVALALQLAGKGAIVAEGSASDASAVSVQRFPLTEGVEAQIRLGELLFEDGSGGLQPDVTVPSSSNEGEKNPAFQAALALARDLKSSAAARHRLPSSASLAPDSSYPEMKYPEQPYRVLAAFRIWGVINYFFPYKDLMGEDWDEVLREFIPRMESAADAVQYSLTVAEMTTHIHDCHAGLDSPVLSNYIGSASPPIRVRMIEGQPVITAFLDEEAARASGAEIGDVILKVDGEDALARLERFAKIRSASTPQWRLYRAATLMIRGPESSQATLTIRDISDQVKELKLPRREAFGQVVTERAGEPYRMLPGNIGYADLDRLTVPMVDEMFEKFKDARAIIFDDRTYPRGTAWAIAPRLSEKDAPIAALFVRRVAMLPDGPLGDLTHQSVEHSFYQTIPHTDKWRYKGKTVMLMDERTLSQAEHTGLFLESANGTKFIGSPTAGADGDVTNFCVPGGFFIYFTGQAVRHADGRQLQRVGLVPDVEVHPTLKGIRAGRDEVLEKALEYLQRELN